MDAVDKVNDFKLSQGDKLDFSDIFNQAGNYTSGSLANYLQLVQAGNNVNIGIDVNGTGNFTQVVQLVGVSGLGTADQLVANGGLIA